MKDHCRAISRALICELIILVKNSPRGGDAVAERVVILVFIKSLSIVFVEDVHGKKGTIERGIAALCKLSYLSEGLEERARFL
jgi:hypothetical protein